ncbi:LytR/AlgR family response regulator transcription factor [Acetivibrio cellulolyticus]|uniref:LytR/AlgR family response regulator transcription factor n=1 Tax=Acetivibrio cellulolyticus TaxID=35830 RepID=UPI0001E2D999|nr:LytTR family DNA-binding domain-containing protein [Acetivibrio cellulolyticus]
MLKVVLCDEDNIYIQLLKKLIMEIAIRNNYNIEIAVMASSPQDVLEYLDKENEISIYILETVYSLSEEDGIELAKAVREKDRDSYIVFCTAHTEYIYKVMTGLIKPSGFLIKQGEAVKIEELKHVMGDIYRDYLNFFAENEAVLNINIGTEIYRIDYNQILYLESYQKKIYVHTENQRIGYYDSLSSLEEKLGENFIRCHKSYIINADKMSRISFSDMKIEMINGTEIDISRTFKGILKDKLKCL